MSMTWLAAADRATFWAHRAWSDFVALPDKERHVAILPLYGFADHGLGLPLDAEEILGSAVLRHAMLQVGGAVPCHVLPSVRFGLAPYPCSFFGIDAETAHALLHDLAAGVKAAGFHKLVFFNTSPWNRELVIDASRDIRIGQKLQTFIINTPALGFDFHPSSEKRGPAQAAVAHVQGRAPQTATRAADIRDADFRPGAYLQPAPLAPDSSIDGAAVVKGAGQHLARLLAEIQARSSLGNNDHRTPAALPNLLPSTSALVFPEKYRARYLPSFTRDELEALPNKERALVIVPTGAIEQHGHHLPVGVDAIFGQAWLENALSRLPNDAPVFVAPPLTYGKSNEHLAFPGTLSVSVTTFRRMLLAVAAQLKALGFRQLAVLNTHGGNSAVVVSTLREIQGTLGLRAGMLKSTFKPDLAAQEAAFGFHAGEWETSLMLAVADELVTMSKAVCEYPAQLSDPGEVRPEDAPAIISWATEDISHSGVMGDATAASHEKGHRWMDAHCAALASRIEELLGR
ncbi:MAG: creatininase family protein [Nibricoccus sp.]